MNILMRNLHSFTISICFDRIYAGFDEVPTHVYTISRTVKSMKYIRTSNHFFHREKTIIYIDEKESNYKIMYESSDTCYHKARQRKKKQCHTSGHGKEKYN